MKTILFIQHYGGMSGSLIGAYNTISMLKDKFSIIMYVKSISNDEEDMFKRLGVTIRILDDSFFELKWFSGGPRVVSRTFLLPFLYIRKSIYTIKKVIETEKPDYVFCNSIVLSWIGKLHRNYRDTRFICHIRETVPSCPRILRSITIKNLNMFDDVLFISQYDMNQIILKCKKTVIHDSITYQDHIYLDKYYSKEHIRNRNTLTVGFVGGDNPIKGLNLLLEAIPLIKSNKKIHLVIAGSISKDNMENLRKKIQIINNNKIEVEILGSYKSVLDFMSSIDVLVCPSVAPHQLRPIFEAGFLAIPIVTTDFIELHDCVKDEYNGLVFENGNSCQLAECIERLVNDDELRKNIGKNNKLKSEKEYSYFSVKEALNRLLG